MARLGRGIYTGGPAHGGHGVGVVQGRLGLAIGAVAGRLRCRGAEGQGWWRGDELCVLDVGDGREGARAVHDVYGKARGLRARAPAGCLAARRGNREVREREGRHGAARTARHCRGHSADHGDVRAGCLSPGVPPRPRPDSSVPVSAVR